MFKKIVLCFCRRTLLKQRREKIEDVICVHIENLNIFIDSVLQNR